MFVVVTTFTLKTCTIIRYIPSNTITERWGSRRKLQYERQFRQNTRVILRKQGAVPVPRKHFTTDVCVGSPWLCATKVWNITRLINVRYCSVRLVCWFTCYIVKTNVYCMSTVSNLQYFIISLFFFFLFQLSCLILSSHFSNHV